jgi:hypothetical protein
MQHLTTLIMNWTIERALSPERFKGYLDRADGDRRKAITLYEEYRAI